MSHNGTGYYIVVTDDDDDDWCFTAPFVHMTGQMDRPTSKIVMTDNSTKSDNIGSHSELSRWLPGIK